MKLHTSKNKKNIHSKGFTIIETLVAIFILLISTTGPLTFTQSGLRSSFLARDQITAFYLAQDVIEVIKNTRDVNTISNNTTDWLDGLEECQPNNNTVVCQMSTGGNNIMIDSCPSGVCDPLGYDADTKQFVMGDENPNDTVSKYTRTIYVSEIEPDQEAQIIVEVSWDTNFFNSKRIVVQEHIYKKY